MTRATQPPKISPTASNVQCHATVALLLINAATPLILPV